MHLYWPRIKKVGNVLRAGHNSQQNIVRGSYRKSWATFFFACELGTADEGECGGRWNQLLCYPWVSCDASSLQHVTSITPNKMADNDMSFRQRAVIEFLVKRIEMSMTVDRTQLCSTKQSVDVAIASSHSLHCTIIEKPQKYADLK